MWPPLSLKHSVTLFSTLLMMFLRKLGSKATMKKDKQKKKEQEKCKKSTKSKQLSSNEKKNSTVSVNE